MSDHSNLLQKAKHNQQNLLTNSNNLSNSLTKSIASLLTSSNNNEILEKFLIINQLNNDINNQLNNIYNNFNQLIKYKSELNKIVLKFLDKLNLSETLDKIQSSIEFVDQNLRIFENTLKLIKKNRSIR